MTTSSPEFGRRAMLRAAALVPAVAGLSTVAGGAARADDVPPVPGRFDAVNPRFTLAVVPDTQYLFDADSADPEPLRETFRYVARHRGDLNIPLLAHLGDVVEHGTEQEIRAADPTFRLLGNLPYSVLAGNHDIDSSTDDQRGDTPYRRAFGPQRFARMPTYRGASPGGYNTAHVFRAAGQDWLLLALDWRVSATDLAWAQSVIDRNPTLPVILTIHELVSADDRGVATLSEFGQGVWDRFVRRNDQIFLTLNGHFWPTGRVTLTNDAGHPVHAHITNYQDQYYGGAGMLRLYNFDLVRGTIDVETISPWLLARRPEQRTPLEAEYVEKTGDRDRFTEEIDFEARFAGFAPPKPPAARPARAVLIAGTVAYWRFDAEGLTGAGADGTPLADAAVARDLTGRGNDLGVRRLGSAAPQTLTVSTDHHIGAPAHASLRFDGARPDRAATLQTRSGAPITTMTFDRGYTIETFLKLPDPFVGDHAFMGVFSFEGRAGDAGKQNGYSPDECTCSLNVSPERFLQYAVYPHTVDAQPTSWSHAIPPGRWTHVAIVNDGRRTVVWVDGSRIARNPTQPAPGIATLGRPFVLGATSSNLAYDQGFYGSLGDTRIVARALRPTEF